MNPQPEVEYLRTQKIQSFHVMETCHHSVIQTIEKIEKINRFICSDLTVHKEQLGHTRVQVE